MDDYYLPLAIALLGILNSAKGIAKCDVKCGCRPEVISGNQVGTISEQHSCKSNSTK